MGGNIKFNTDKAEQIDLTIVSRKEICNDISRALLAIHQSLNCKLFGKNAIALKQKIVYSGSTAHLFNDDISDSELIKYKNTFGDIDVQISKEHLGLIRESIVPGQQYGNYTIVDTKKAGFEHHVLMKHKNGQLHQFDFEAVEYFNNFPSKFERFCHSSDWEDTMCGIKGAHHKILLNALVSPTHKFSISHGMRLRVKEGQEENPAVRDVYLITKHIFGPNADYHLLKSFIGIVKLIGDFLPNDRQEQIKDKFIESVKQHKYLNVAAPLSCMNGILNKDL